MKSSFAVILILAQTLSLNTLAQNRGRADVLFNEPAEARGTQLMLGVAEYIAAARLAPKLRPDQIRMSEAEFELQTVQDRATSRAHQKEIVNSIVNNPKNYLTDGVFSEDLRLEARVRLHEMKRFPFISAEEKAFLVEVAKENLNIAREESLKVAQRMGKIDKSMHILRRGTSVIMVFDVIGRVLVWNILEADPTMSPIGTYIQHQIQK